MNFFSLLKKKISFSADRNFDQRFWQKFDAEFGTSKQTAELEATAFWKKYLRWAIPTLTAVSLTLSAVLYVEHQRLSVEQEILSHEQIVDHLDLFMTFEDVSKLTDNDWNMLLSEEKAKDNQDEEEDDGSNNNSGINYHDEKGTS